MAQAVGKDDACPVDDPSWLSCLISRKSQASHTRNLSPFIQISPVLAFEKYLVGPRCQRLRVWNVGV
jgi:hypothetical protein